MERARKEDRVELELIMAVENLGKYAAFNPTHATPGENLPEGLTRSNTSFLLSMRVVEVHLNEEKVKTKMAFLQ